MNNLFESNYKRATFSLFVCFFERISAHFKSWKIIFNSRSYHCMIWLLKKAFYISVHHYILILYILTHGV